MGLERLIGLRSAALSNGDRGKTTPKLLEPFAGNVFYTGVKGTDKRQHDRTQPNISGIVVELLSELQPHTGNGEFVFPQVRNKTRPISENAVLAALRSLGLGQDEIVGHSFRAIGRTFLDERLGFRVEVIEMQLGHRVRDSLGRAYNRTTFIAERREMMEKWSEYLNNLSVN